MLKLKDLVKSNRRREWAALKSKYGKLLVAQKIDFDAKFGPLLDKYQSQLGPVDKLFSQQAVTPQAVDKVVAAARPLKSVAESYRAKVKGKGGPLEKDITAFLKEVESECDDWEKARDMVANESIAGRNTPAQIKAVGEAYGVFDALGQTLINMVRGLPDAVARAKKVAAEAKYALYTKEAKKAMPEKDWRRDLGADMAMVASHVTALNTLARTADASVKRLIAGSVSFDERADYAAFKSLATSFASGSTLKDFKQRAGALDQWMKGVVEQREDYVSGSMRIAGADIAHIRRAAVNASQAVGHLVDPVIATVRRLP